MAIGAIVKNEAPYLLEWIAYHRVVGVDRFCIADNGSDDGTSELLRALEAAGIITCFAFSHPVGSAPQLPAYAEILQRFGGRADWMAFIDADEFLLPTDGEHSILPAIQKLDAISKAGAIAVNWSIYGSSNHDDERDEPVIERFSYRAERDFDVNHHYKSIVRTAAVRGVGNNPHLFLLRRGYQMINSDGSRLVGLNNQPGLSAEVIWTPIRINHYVVKSWREFAQRKRLRGRASAVGLSRSASFFSLHDRNDVYDPIGHGLLQETKAEMERLAHRLAPYSLTGNRLQGRKEAGVQSSPQTSAPQKPVRKLIRGALDKVVVEGGTVSLTGWALASDGGQIPFLTAEFGSYVVRDTDLRMLARPDVVQRIPNAHMLCGYCISFPLSSIPPRAIDEDTISILAGDSSEFLEFEVAIGGSGTTAPVPIREQWHSIFASETL